jgi:hypothetical protein
MQIRDILIKDHILIICSETAKPETIQAKFGLIWFIGFRDEDINVTTYDI